MVTKLKMFLTQNEILQFEAARQAGLTETRMSRLATGRAKPTAEEMQRLCLALGAPREQLFDTAE